MDGADLEVLRSVLAWAEAGQPFALVTVVRTWGSAPRPAGAWLGLGRDGVLAGSVSGGCVEDDLLARLRRGELDGPSPRLLTYGVTREEAAWVGLPCGGTLELVVEPAPDPGVLAELRARIGRGEVVTRTLDLSTGTAALAPAEREAGLRLDERHLVTVHGPRWRLLIIGAGQIARYVAEMARALDYRVSVCDPREEYVRSWSEGIAAELLTSMPDDAVLALRPDPHTAVVTLTHDPRLDDLALMEALRTPAFYVGALGSRASQASRRERLLGLGLCAAEVGRLRGPVGLAIGSRTPAEIAVSILAEMTAVKNGIGRAD
jgi:xanthine dehydrogenase accessory factor